MSAKPIPTKFLTPSDVTRTRVAGVDLLQALGKDTPVPIPEFHVTERRSTVRSIVTRETALLLGFVFVGLVLLPVAIYLVGKAIFGDYGGGGFGHFYSDLSGRIRGGDFAAWFLVMSPYLGWQTLRLIGLGWRLAGRRPQPRGQ